MDTLCLKILGYIFKKWWIWELFTYFKLHQLFQLWWKLPLYWDRPTSNPCYNVLSLWQEVGMTYRALLRWSKAQSAPCAGAEPAQGRWGVSKIIFAITMAEKQSMRQAHSLKGLDLRSELVMGVSWVCCRCIFHKPIRVSRPHAFKTLAGGGAVLRWRSLDVRLSASPLPLPWPSSHDH